jgi:hypothetical protein
MKIPRFLSRPKGRSQAYLSPGRLEDVLALIQVLGLDGPTHRGEKALQEALEGTPQSVRTWTEVAKAHPEFFRVYPGKEDLSVSLVARHTVGGEEGREFSRALIGHMIDAAIKIHDSQLRRRQILHVTRLGALLLILPALMSVLASAATIFEVFRKK